MINRKDVDREDSLSGQTETSAENGKTERERKLNEIV